MKKTILTNEYISIFCLQVSLLLHAGISLADGIQLLGEDEKDPDCRRVLISMAEKLDEGMGLSDAMKAVDVFPKYVINMAETGEITGRLEQTFQSMAEYYDGQRQLQTRLRSAIAYPFMLLILMLLIIGILLVKVLPVFSQVYEQLGGSMNGLAGGLLAVGRGLEAALPVIGLLAVIALMAVLLVCYHEGMRNACIQYIKRVTSGSRLAKEIYSARFAAALSMGMASGLPIEEALKLATEFLSEIPKEYEKYASCLSMVEAGETLPDSLRTAEVFDAVYCRMLMLGQRSGTSDMVMGEIARRLEEQAEDSIEDLVSKVEPTIVLAASGMVGIILLAVMLPLMNIMASIG